MVDEFAIAGLGDAKGAFDLASLAGFFVQSGGVANRGVEDFRGQAALGDIVGGTGLHRLDRDRLVTLPGEHDDRAVETVITDYAQQVQPGIGAQMIVEETQVETRAVELAARILHIVDMLEAAHRRDPAEQRTEQHHVVGIVLDQEDFQPDHAGAPAAGRISRHFRISRRSTIRRPRHARDPEASRRTYCRHRAR